MPLVFAVIDLVRQGDTDALTQLLRHHDRPHVLLHWALFVTTDLLNETVQMVRGVSFGWLVERRQLMAFEPPAE